MNRSISAAVLISIVLHVAVFLNLLLARADQPPLAGAPTLINIQFWPQDDRQRSGEHSPEPSFEPADPAATPTAPQRGPALSAAPVAEEAVENAGSLRATSPAEPITAVSAAPLEAPGEAAPATAAQGEGLAIDRSNLLATIRPRAVKVPPRAERLDPAPEKLPMSPTEQRMLSEKFRQLSEDYYRLEPDASGLSWEYRGQQYRARFTPEPAADETGIERVWVEISSEHGGVTKSARMRMKRLAFSNFAQFVDRWDPEVQIHDDELDGRFHTNSRIHLSASREARPRFLGKVTTSSRGIDTSASKRRVRRDEIFLGGLETAVGKIRLPKRYLPFPAPAEVDPEQVRSFDEDTRITFYADGTYGWKTAGAPAGEVVQAIPEALYLVGAKKKKLYVSGVVRGKVLVFSPYRIVIAGSLTYAEDPHRSPGAGDYLGLVCDQTIEVAHPNVTGPGDLEIHAAIYAKRRFAVSGYRLRHRAMLTIFGSLTAGTLSATEPRFATRIQFDQRLEDARPPGFPVSDRYEFEPWDGEWEIEQAIEGT